MRDNRRVDFQYAVCLIVVAAGVCAASCRTNGPRAYRTELANTGKPALHAVRSDRLRVLMDALNRQVFDRMPQELDAKRERQLRMDELAGIARKLAGDAQYIPDVLQEVRALLPEDRKLFIGLSDKLRAQALEMEDQARRHRLDAARQTMERIIVTCNACHAAFRILPEVREDSPNAKVQD